MSKDTREDAKAGRYHINMAEKHLKEATRYLTPDKKLSETVRKISEQVGAAGQELNKKLEGQ